MKKKFLSILSFLLLSLTVVSQAITVRIISTNDMHAALDKFLAAS